VSRTGSTEWPHARSAGAEALELVRTVRAGVTSLGVAVVSRAGEALPLLSTPDGRRRWSRDRASCQVLTSLGWSAASTG